MRLSYMIVITCDILMSFIALFNQLSSAYEIKSAGDALEYLSHFGYLEDLKKHPHVDIKDAREAVREFQDMANLKPTGKLTLRTLKEMNRPRCGNRDMRIAEGDELGIDIGQVRKSRGKRATSPGVRWHKRELTYKVTQFASSSLKPKKLQNELDLAFKYWERTANLTFKKLWDSKKRPDIEIRFERGNHGDEEAFDGPSSTLAHAFYPARGDIHFDDEERWTANAKFGHNLRTVATHEIGHALGLGHSKEKESVMYEMYKGFKETLHLHESDINAIQELYGPKITKDSLTNQNEVYKLKFPTTSLKLQGMVSNPETADLCVNSSIDAISTLADGHIYIFKGNYYYKVSMGQPIDYSEYPKRINETFHGLPSNLDTVLTVSNGRTYFFKGRQYWRSKGTTMDHGYPKKIADNFLGIPNNLDASFVWSWNNMVYFFKKNRYWRYNFNTPNKKAEASSKSGKSTRHIRHQHNKKKRRTELIEGYPKKVSTNWPGLPDNIEDGFKAPNGRTYVFKAGEYWQFHDPDSDVEAASYPRSSGEWWFGCSDFVPDARKIRNVKKLKPYVYL